MMAANKSSATKHAVAFNLSFLVYVVMLLVLVPTLTQVVADKARQDFVIIGLFLLRVICSLSLGVLAVLPLYFAFRNGLPRSCSGLVFIAGLMSLYLTLNRFDLGAFSVPVLRVYCATPDSCLFLLGYCGCTIIAMRRTKGWRRGVPSE